MTVEILSAIIVICGVNAIEDNKSDWMEFKKMQKLQKECRVYYYNCMGPSRLWSTGKLTKCDKEKK